MCSLLKVSKGGYYAWRDRDEAPRVRSDRRLLVLIRAIFEESRQTYGSPRVYAELRAVGEKVGRKRVERLMRTSGLRARERRAWRRTTDSRHDNPIAPNSLDRHFTAPAPNQVWSGDTTYIPTAEGWLFLVVILDLYSRKVVGWALGGRLDGQLATRALRSAIETRGPEAGLLFHSDRGMEFTCDAFQSTLRKAGGVASMSRTGNCWDNAVTESFFSTLKIELVHRLSFSTRKGAETAVFYFLEAFYNRRRRHSSLGYVSPEQFELAA